MQPGPAHLPHPLGATQRHSTSNGWVPFRLHQNPIWVRPLLSINGLRTSDVIPLFSLKNKSSHSPETAWEAWVRETTSPVPFYAVDLDGNGALRSGCWTVRRWATSQEWYCPTGQPACIYQQAPTRSVQTLPPAIHSPTSNKEARLSFQLGKLYAHRTAHRICRQRRQSGRSCSVSCFFRGPPVVPECPPFFLQVTSPTSRIDAYENNARPRQTAATRAGPARPTRVRMKENRRTACHIN